MARKLQDWIKAYMSYTRHSEAPEEFHFWTAVSTIAGALRRKVYLDQAYFQWSPNFYIIFVAPPGIATKSTSLGIGTALLNDVPGIKLGPNALTWQYLPKAMSDACFAYPTPNGEFYTMSPLTFSIGELGSFLDTKDAKMLDLLVDLWDGKEGKWEKATKTGGKDEIVNPWINIIACTTPSWLNENIHASMVGGGFISRCIFIFADRKRQLVAYPKDRITEGDKKLKEDLVSDLTEIAETFGEYTLTEEAKEWGVEWYENLWKRYQGKDTDVTAGFCARMQCHIHKLAIVLRAAKGNETVLQKSDLVTASMLIEAVEKNLPQVFRAVESTDEMAAVERVIRTVEGQKEVMQRFLYRRFMAMMSEYEFKRAIQAGVMAGRIRTENRDNVVWVIRNEG